MILVVLTVIVSKTDNLGIKILAVSKCRVAGLL